MGKQALVGVAVLSLLLGGAVGWFARGAQSGTDDTSLTADADTPREDTDRPRLEADADMAAARMAQLELDLKAAVEERDAIKAELEKATRESAGYPTEAARIAAATELKEPRYVYEGLDKPLGEMNWQKIAESVVGMSKPMQEFGKRVAAGEDAREVQMRIRKFNMPLLQAAVDANQSGLAGFGVNGSFTHPALVVNLVYATLIEGGQPLSDAQSERLSQLGDQYVANDAKMRAGFGDDAFAIESLVLESELKDRLYKDIDALLTPAQIAVLHPPSLRDRAAGDIFSAALVWMQTMQAAQVTDVEDLVNKVTAGLGRRLQVPDGERAALQQAVENWSTKFGPEHFTPLDNLEKKSMMKMSRIRVAGRPMVELYKELASSFANDPALVGRIKASTFLVIPAGR